MEILAIDYGDKNIGLAISDEKNIIAKRLPGLKVKNMKEAVSEITRIAQDHTINLILIGKPERKGTTQQKINRFKELLENKLNFSIKIKFINEDFTSFFAELGRSRKFKKEKSHSEAARIMLQEYLDFLEESK